MFLFVCSIYSECAVAIYSECMDAYTMFYTYFESLVVYAQCVGVYVVSVSISAGCECVYIVRICIYAKCQ